MTVAATRVQRPRRWLHADLPAIAIDRHYRGDLEVFRLGKSAAKCGFAHREIIVDRQTRWCGWCRIRASAV